MRTKNSDSKIVDETIETAEKVSSKLNSFIVKGSRTFTYTDYSQYRRANLKLQVIFGVDLFLTFGFIFSPGGLFNALYCIQILLTGVVIWNMTTKASKLLMMNKENKRNLKMYGISLKNVEISDVSKKIHKIAENMNIAYTSEVIPVPVFSLKNLLFSRANPYDDEVIFPVIDAHLQMSSQVSTLIQNGAKVGVVITIPIELEEKFLTKYPSAKVMEDAVYDKPTWVDRLAFKEMVYPFQEEYKTLLID
ncbi:hypothetical protein JOC36_001525 [Weissella uvarum]|uniref:hypothetical protein n=1 Tax=Weissella uvarum TaxID=1479233 RepID=UPI00195FCD47|nr:hypothetical protein [Weissella uvarum]MBM7617932.1 hypothetical protein [Weissella uvarum]MCM0596072.1 hypothetical protein [Weissella uvarum]